MVHRGEPAPAVMPDSAWPDDLESDSPDHADPEWAEDFGEYPEFEGLEPIDPAELFDLHAAAFLEFATWPAWMADASCAGMGADRFIPSSRSGWRRAVVVCEECLVREPCLEFALSQPVEEDFGVWGGTTRKERKGIRAERGLPVRGRPGGGRVDHVRAELRDSAVALRDRGLAVRAIVDELHVASSVVSSLLAEAEREALRLKRRASERAAKRSRQRHEERTPA